MILVGFLGVSAASVESDWVTIHRIIDGDSLVVVGSAGGKPVPVAVRLLQVNAPEMRQNGATSAHGQQAKAFVEQLLQPGDQVRLWGPKKEFTADGHGRVLAVVQLESGSTVQELLIQQGWSAYWRRYGEVQHDEWHPAWQEAQKVARSEKRAMWSMDPTWMRQQALAGDKK